MMETYVDPAAVAANDDRLERSRTIRRLLDQGSEQQSIAQCAFLLGEPASGFSGALTKRLVQEVRERRLRAAADLDRAPYGAEFVSRRNPGTTPVDRDELRVWIETHGDQRARNSAAAVWCGLITLTQFEREGG